MITFEDEVRNALGDLADQARPVALGEVALARVRRRRRRAVAAAAVAVLAAAALPIGLVNLLDQRAGSQAEPAQPQPPDAGAGGTVVVTSYRDGGDLYVLDPEAGTYRRWPAEVSVGRLSPDLRWSAALTGPFDETAPAVVLRSTADPDRHRTISLPERAGSWPLSLAWSPESTRLAVVSEGDPGIHGIVVVDVQAASVREVDLEFPAGRSGWDGYGQVQPYAVAQWLDEARIAVPVIAATDVRSGDRTGRLPDLTAEETGGPDYPPPDGFVIYSLAVFDLTGSLVDELPIDTSDIDRSDAPHAGMIWAPTGLSHGGMQVLYREPTLDRFEFAVVDLAAGQGTYHGVGASMDMRAEGDGYPGEFIAWLPEDGLVVRPASPRAEDAQARGALRLVDLDSGEVRAFRLPEASDGAEVIPSTASDLTVAAAIGLPAQSARLAFSLEE